MSNGRRNPQHKDLKHASPSGKPQDNSEPPHNLDIAPLVHQIKDLVATYKANALSDSARADAGLRLNRTGVIAASIAAVAAFAAFGIAFTQWSDANANFRIDQRAWMAISFPPPQTFPEGQSMTIGFTITNTGKTPARDVVGEFISVVMRADEAPTFPPEHGTRLMFPSMFPNETRTGASTLMVRGGPSGSASARCHC